MPTEITQTWKTIDGAELKVGDHYWTPDYHWKNNWARTVTRNTIAECTNDWYVEMYGYSTREAAYAAARKVIEDWMEKQQQTAVAYLAELARALASGTDCD